MIPHTAVYRCFYCQHDLHRIRNTGRERLLWCSHCACTRVFVREDERLEARTWPPPAREESP